jgi:hypothetical protein
LQQQTHDPQERLLGRVVVLKDFLQRNHRLPASLSTRAGNYLRVDAEKSLAVQVCSPLDDKEIET